MIPQDPVMLLSYVNTKLRDFYNSVEELCREESISVTELQGILGTIDYHYNRDTNRFE